MLVTENYLARAFLILDSLSKEHGGDTQKLMFPRKGIQNRALHCEINWLLVKDLNSK